MQPDTNYVRLGQDRIGYQVFGHDPPDVVTTIGSFSHMDLVWEDPRVALYFRSLGSFSRVIRFDRRGTGVSDRLRLELLPPWESWAEELAVVLDARLHQVDQLWGTEAMAASMVPSRVDDAQFRRWWARLQRATAPQGPWRPSNAPWPRSTPAPCLP